MSRRVLWETIGLEMPNPWPVFDLLQERVVVEVQAEEAATVLS